MGLYNRVTGSAGNQTQLKGSWSPWGPASRNAGMEHPTSREPEPFKPIELEQAFSGACRAIGLMEDPRWMLIRSLIEYGKD